MFLTRNFDVSYIFCVKLVKVVMKMLFSVVDYIGLHLKRTENVSFEF